MLFDGNDCEFRINYRTSLEFRPNSGPKSLGVFYVNISSHLKTIGMTELVDQTLRPLSLFHNTLLIVLAYRATQFVIIHGRPVLTLSPKSGHTYGVLDFENPFWPIHPSDTTAVYLWL